MAKKLMIIYFQILKTNQALQVILTNQYIKRDGNIMAYTIGGQQALDEMQKNLIR